MELTRRHAAGLGAVTSAVAFSGSTGQDWVQGVLIAAAALATGALVLAVATRGHRLERSLLGAWAAGGVAVALIELVVRQLVGRSLGVPEAVGLVPVALVLLGVVRWLGERPGPLAAGWPWLLGALFFLVATLYISVEPAPEIDVLLSNRAGADALARGENPYVTAVVPDTNPFLDESSTFEGYVYPPLALILYSVSDWVFGDTRWINALAMAGFVVGLGLAGRRFGVGSSTAALMLPFLIKPASGLIMRFGWTEPIALPFLLGGALLWRRRPLASAVLLGLGFATKQYFVLALPLLMVWDDDWRWRRVGVVSAVAVATVLPFALVDPVAYWNATVAPSLSAAVRPDSIGLAGLGIALPPVLTIGLPVLVAVLAGRRGGGAGAFLMGLAALLATSFFVGFQSFANYWYVVYALATAGLVLSVGEVQDAEPTQRARTAFAR